LTTENKTLGTSISENFPSPQKTNDFLEKHISQKQQNHIRNNLEAMAFSFNFGGDDIDQTVDQDIPIQDAASTDSHNTSQPAPAVNVLQHDLRELYSTLPDRLCYSTAQIVSPTGKVLLLPRRELFDIRVQLMSEASSDNDNDTTLSQLQSTDLAPNVYEGGFKTWECSVDLSSLLLDRGPRKDIDEVVRCDGIVELGAGSALPSLTLFQHCLRNGISQTFTLTDYNSSVLRLVTLPNLILTWATCTSPPLIDLTAEPSGDFENIPALLPEFLSSLAASRIQLSFISGPWGETLASLIPESAPDMGSLILASETIYSPASTTAFVDLLIHLLRRTKMAKAIVAAKRFYFGVGGSVDHLKEVCAEKGAVAYEVENSGVPGMDSGVGRALIEVQMY
jgi:protein-histidine N-methyltransferase